MSESVLGTGAAGCAEHPDLTAAELVDHNCADTVQVPEDHTLDSDDSEDEGVEV